MNGIVIVNKPKGFTSQDVVSKVKKILNQKKAGHTGTLDPMATGVLPVLLGNSTKLSKYLIEHDKVYVAKIKLGQKSSTGDSEGEVIEEKAVSELSLIKIEEVFRSFLGKQKQIPPIYSAIKVNGKKLYEYARNNEEVILPKKEVTIYEIELLEYNVVDNKTIVKFKCLVSKGTYIRSLIKDIAKSINKSAVMSDLRRIKQGNFDINISNNIDEEYNIIPISEVLKDYYTVELDEKLEKKILNGCIIDNIYNKDYVLFKNKDNLFLYKNENNKLKPFKMFL